MVIIFLKGGLGNQLFQYAIGERMRLNGIEIRYHFDDDLRIFRLTCFDTNIITLSEGELIYFNEKYKPISKRPVSMKLGFLNKILRKFNLYFHDLFYLKNDTIHERLFFDKRIFNIKGPKILEGYWADVRYFDTIKNHLQSQINIITEFKISEYLSAVNKIESCKQSVSIHVRRGDYLDKSNASIFKQLELEYYENAIDIMKEKMDEVKFFVFSNDIEWCKTMFTKENIHFMDSENLTDIHDFSLMKSCRHNIIANSTFSWWAAYLNKDDNNTVIMPEIWYESKRMQKKYSNGFLRINGALKL